VLAQIDELQPNEGAPKEEAKPAAETKPAA